MRRAALDLRPFAWVATLAFLGGFGGYVALAWPGGSATDAPPWAGAVAAETRA